MPNDVTPSRQAEELATAFLSRVWNGTANDLGAIDELMTEDYQIHSAMKTISGRNAFRRWVADFQTVLTSARNEILEVFANAAGDRVVSVDVLGFQQRDIWSSRRRSPRQVFGDRNLACRKRTTRGMLDRARGA